MSPFKNGKLFPFVLLTTLVLSTVAVIGCGIYKNENIQKVNEEKVRADNKKMELVYNEAQKSDNLNYKYKDKKWYVLGDSISVGGIYQNSVSGLCKMASVKTDALNGQLLRTMADRLTSEKLTGVDLVTVFGGTNDYGYSTKLGSINDTKTTNTFYGHCKKVIDKIHTLNPNANIVFITPLKRGKFENQPIYPAKNNAGAGLNDYVNAIKDVCNQNNIKVIDLFSTSGIDENNLTRYTSDGLHPNTDGYEKISKIIADSLNR